MLLSPLPQLQLAAKLLSEQRILVSLDERLPRVLTNLNYKEKINRRRVSQKRMPRPQINMIYNHLDSCSSME